MKRFVALALALSAMMCVGGPAVGETLVDEIDLLVSPHTLILDSVQQGAVTVHTDVPYRLAVPTSLRLNGVVPTAVWADDTGCIAARFREASIEALVAPPAARLTLTGLYRLGGAFIGTDTVLVRYKLR